MKHQLAKIGSLEEKLVYLESQHELKARKLDLEQCERSECLRFRGFEVRGKETKEECESMVKNYIKDTLKINIGENDYNRIHRVRPKITIKKWSCSPTSNCKV